MTRFSFLVLLAVSACLNAAESRARREESVGHLERDGLLVDVDGGHAAVRSLDAHAVTLWAQAPELVMTLQPAPGTTTIRIDNVLADSQLSALDAAGVVDAVERLSPTESVWTITTTARARFALTVADSNDTSPWRFIMFADVQ
ncbi:MAG: metallophosphoesterase, partial [Clostridia bacterium]|nr:metallophosphoesterase [Deltaproteobacteria bacterium]